MKSSGYLFITGQYTTKAYGTITDVVVSIEFFPMQRMVTNWEKISSKGHNKQPLIFTFYTRVQIANSNRPNLLQETTNAREPCNV